MTIATTTPALDLGNVLVGATSAPQTATFVNTGNAATASCDNPAFGLAPTAIGAGTGVAPSTTDIAVTFCPTAVGTVSGTITAGAATLVVSGTGVELTASAKTLNFGDVTVGMSESQTVTFTNAGGAVTLTKEGAAFSVAPSLSISEGAADAAVETTLTVTFSPTAAGLVEGSLKSGGVTRCTLVGQGVALPTSLKLEFGAQLVNVANTRNLAIPNNTESAIVIQSGSGQGFSWPTLTIAAKQTGSLAVTFTPPTPGAKSASAAAGTISLTFEGEGVDQAGEAAVVSEADRDLDAVTTGADTPTANDKFWAVEIEHYGPKTFATPGASHSVLTDISGISQDTASADTQQYHTYLRIGTADTGSDTASGNDLARMISSFYDDTRLTDTGGAATNQLGHGQRQNESAIMHSKGGWRSHTEGNRIDTTRGDKLEVVRGNYQMIVLGRQDSSSNKSRYEASGGHFSRDNDNMTPGCLREIRWQGDKFGGTWRLVEETVRGESITRYQGNSYEQYYGDEIKSYIGSSTSSGTVPARSQDPTAAQSSTAAEFAADQWITADSETKYGNPKIHEKIYAKSFQVEEHYGSGASAVDYYLWISDTAGSSNYDAVDGHGDVSPSAPAKGFKEYWYGKYDEKFTTNDQDFDSEIDAGSGKLTETVDAGSIESKTTSDGQYYEKLQGLNVNQVTIGLGSVADSVVGLGTVTNTTFSIAMLNEFDIGAVTRTAVAIGGVNTDIKLGVVCMDLAAAGVILDAQIAAVKVDVYKALRVKETSMTIDANGVASLETTPLKVIT